MGILCSELRIGNLFYHGGKIVKVVGIDKKHVNILKDPLQFYFHTVPINGLEPIPLTEDVICNIKYQDTIWIGSNNDFCFLHNNGKEYLFDKSEILYLHQFQNLHYLLTEKELKYNE